MLEHSLSIQLHRCIAGMRFQSTETRFKRTNTKIPQKRRETHCRQLPEHTNNDIYDKWWLIHCDLSANHWLALNVIRRHSTFSVAKSNRHSADKHATIRAIIICTQIMALHTYSITRHQIHDDALHKWALKYSLYNIKHRHNWWHTEKTVIKLSGVQQEVFNADNIDSVQRMKWRDNRSSSTEDSALCEPEEATIRRARTVNHRQNKRLKSQRVYLSPIVIKLDSA